jgi:hypothetical protein
MAPSAGFLPSAAGAFGFESTDLGSGAKISTGFGSGDLASDDFLVVSTGFFSDPLASPGLAPDFFLLSDLDLALSSPLAVRLDARPGAAGHCLQIAGDSSRGFSAGGIVLAENYRAPLVRHTCLGLAAICDSPSEAKSWAGLLPRSRLSCAQDPPARQSANTPITSRMPRRSTVIFISSLAPLSLHTHVR